MSKKKKKEVIGKIDSVQLFQAEKPRYNAFQCGTGAFGDKKFNRTKSKRTAIKEMRMYA